ncbi:hypothetical protein C8R43DRAFT_885688 [Mycena crocata]|nr:hypothetical protein C8R43DRAFT_885688 [Mycena crocata]
MFVIASLFKFHILTGFYTVLCLTGPPGTRPFLISILTVYIYRDVLPLSKVSGTSQDFDNGNILWIWIGLLGFSGVTLPQLTPRRYTPVALNPVAEPSPEQTASILSLRLYTFLDPIIFHQVFPPLADYDSAQHLRSKSFEVFRSFQLAARTDCQVQDHPAKSHLFFGIVRVFRRDIFTLAATSVVIAFGKFVAPIGMNQLLRRVRLPGEGVSIRPWVWILWLFAGPTMSSLSEQWYMFIISRATVRVENILTEFVFEHALRTRLKSDPTVSKGSVQRHSLLGRLNSMITTDIRIIIGAKRLMLSLVYMPLTLILSVWFLYAVLGWR